MQITRAEDVPLTRRVVAFVVLMIFEFFYGWSWNTVDVLRPQIRESLGLTLTRAGSTYTAQSIGAMVGAIALGMLADQWGRRRTLFWVVVGYSVMGGMGTVVGSYPQLLAQRFLLGFFLGAIFPVLIATYMGLFADNLRGKLAALGQGTYNLSVIALGQAYRFFGESGDWHTLLWVGAIPSLVLAPLIFLLIPEGTRLGGRRGAAADRQAADRRTVQSGIAADHIPAFPTRRPQFLRLPSIRRLGDDLLEGGEGLFGRYRGRRHLVAVHRRGAGLLGLVFRSLWASAGGGGFLHRRGLGRPLPNRAGRSRRAAVGRGAMGLHDHRLGRLGAMDERAVPGPSALHSNVDL